MSAAQPYERQCASTLVEPDGPCNLPSQRQRGEKKVNLWMAMPAIHVVPQLEYEIYILLCILYIGIAFATRISTSIPLNLEIPNDSILEMGCTLDLRGMCVCAPV